MRILPRPRDEEDQLFEAGTVFETCVGMVRERSLQTQLRSERPTVEAEAGDYNTKASNSQLYQIQPRAQVGVLSGDKMVRLYTLRMVPKRSRGRHIYDRIMSAPAHLRCPFCGVGTVNTLDHYLPKVHFPVFSVTPNNLVPACAWCQREKANYFPVTADGQLLHPYFDSVGVDLWLKAEVVAGTPAAFRFFASPPDSWPTAQKARVEIHLEKLKLSALFAANAGSRLAEIRSSLVTLYQNGHGAAAVREYLSEALVSSEAEQLNSWTTAMYRAALESNWFCDGGFLAP